MQIQELASCCSAVWAHYIEEATYDYTNHCYLPLDMEKALKDVEEAVKRTAWPQKAFILVALSDRQQGMPNIVEGLIKGGYVPIAAGIGAHDTPVYLYCKFHQQLPLPVVPEKEEKKETVVEKKLHPVPSQLAENAKPPLPKAAKFL